MKSKFISTMAIFVAMFMVTAMAQARPAASYKGAKYVFYFIGDGMSMAQVHGVEAYLAAKYEQTTDKYGNPVTVPTRPVAAPRLLMSQFPVAGMITTYDYGSFITDSASAGTALASGKKTLSGVINKSPDFGTCYITMAEQARDMGKKIAIITSVSLDHATPASFYAHQNSRGNTYEIAMELAVSDFDYFAGGGFTKPEKPGLISVYDALAANGYSYINDKAAFNSLTPAAGKVVAVNPILDKSKALPYEIDRLNDIENNISLAEFTKKGIEMIYDDKNPYGFFMMVEGGKIDWANHANDARAALEDTIAFNDAIAQAVEFYNEHPKDTLIVVTSDHDCGGMSLGWAGTGYNSRFDILDGQTMSYEAFDAQVKVYRDKYLVAETDELTGMISYVYTGPTDIDTEMKAMITTAFGMDIEMLSTSQMQKIEDAFDTAMAGLKGDSLLYGGYNPLSVSLTHTLNNNAGIAYTSYAHTGIPVPVMAIGKDSYLFAGYYDNTECGMKLARAMKVILSN